MNIPMIPKLSPLSEDKFRRQTRMSTFMLRVMKSYVHYDGIGYPTIPLNVPDIGFILNPEEWAWQRFKYLVLYDNDEYLNELYKFLKYIHKIYTSNGD